MKLQELILIQHDVLILEILEGSSFKETQILFTSRVQNKGQLLKVLFTKAVG